MSALERTSIGPFNSDDAIEPDGICCEVVPASPTVLQTAPTRLVAVVFGEEEIWNLVLGRGLTSERQQMLLENRTTDRWIVEHDHGRLAALLKKDGLQSVTTRDGLSTGYFKGLGGRWLSLLSYHLLLLFP